MKTLKCRTPRNRFNNQFSTVFGQFANDFFKDLDPNYRSNYAKAAAKKGASVNIAESDTAFDIEVAFPGLKKEDFNISIEKDILSIAAEIKTQTGETNEETEATTTTNTRKYVRREFSYNSFKRSFYLPETVNANAISAKYESGILLVNLPKLEEKVADPKRTIEIG